MAQQRGNKTAPGTRIAGGVGVEDGIQIGKTRRIIKLVRILQSFHLSVRSSYHALVQPQKAPATVFCCATYALCRAFPPRRHRAFAILQRRKSKPRDKMQLPKDATEKNCRLKSKSSRNILEGVLPPVGKHEIRKTPLSSPDCSAILFRKPPVTGPKITTAL